MTDLLSFELNPVSYTVAGAAKATGISTKTIHGAIHAGDLVAHTISRRPTSKRIILRKDLEAWLESLPVWTRDR